MDVDSFTQQALADGYAAPMQRDLTVATGPDDHTHEFDARLLILDGAFSLTIAGEKRTYVPGETCEVPAGTVHAEEVGPHGATLLVAKRGGDAA